ncbi:MAG: hypothetical protein HUU23_12820 [Caldilineales bacterium]|nr:hypothetical protein [Caldilineales bacterium]
MFYESPWVPTTNRLDDDQGSLYIHVAIDDQAGNDIQEKAFPDSKAVTDQICQMIIEHQRGFQQIVMLRQENAVLLALTQAINRDHGLKIRDRRWTLHPDDRVFDPLLRDLRITKRNLPDQTDSAQRLIRRIGFPEVSRF